MIKVKATEMDTIRMSFKDSEIWTRNDGQFEAIMPALEQAMDGGFIVKVMVATVRRRNGSGFKVGDAYKAIMSSAKIEEQTIWNADRVFSLQQIEEVINTGDIEHDGKANYFLVKGRWDMYAVDVRIFPNGKQQIYLATMKTPYMEGDRVWDIRRAEKFGSERPVAHIAGRRPTVGICELFITLVVLAATTGVILTVIEVLTQWRMF